MNLSELDCKIQNYAWGSRSFIAELQGRQSPTAEPEAELWIGAHAGAPARVVQGEDRQRLDELIAHDATKLLGADIARSFDGELPFLLKVLAAAEPLSLQAHPSMAQAVAGFAADESNGIPLTAAHRSYKDRRHKPELIVALTPFVALSGFRAVSRTRELFAELAVASLAGALKPLSEQAPEAALKAVFERLMTAAESERQRWVNDTVAAAKRAALPSSAFAREFAWVARLNELYPGDIGVVSALLLNLVELEPFQGLYLPAGNLHAYLDGSGVEIMAASDNVLRGGLTKKAVNVPELLRVLEFREFPVELILPQAGETKEHVYRTPAAEFRLSYLELDAAPQRLADRRGPELLLATKGRVRIASESSALLLERGRAAFVPAEVGALTLEGPGTLFRACVP